MSLGTASCQHIFLEMIGEQDMIKSINSLCSWARLPTTVEVWGLFSHLIPQEALNKIESVRPRLGLVPDFRIKFPPTSTLGEDQVKLAELKLIS